MSPTHVADSVFDCSLVDLLRRAQLGSEGSEDASQLLFDRLRTPLLSVIRQVIQPRVRQLYDSEDFLSETFLKIFTTHFTDEVLQSPERFLSYLKRIAENKVRDANRKYLSSERHNLNRVVSLDSLTSEQRERSLCDTNQSVDELAFLKELVEEELERLLAELPTLMRTIIRLLLQGASTHEIANRLAIEPKRVYRAMHWLQKALRKHAIE